MIWKSKLRHTLKRIITVNNYFVVAEIGVGEGKTASHLLKKCFLKSYVGVDNYLHDRGSQKAIAEKIFNDYDHAGLLICDSVQASQSFDDGSFDLVFIDGDHSYDGCKRDLIAWLPKVRKGGFLVGANYDPLVFHDLVVAVKEILGKDNIVVYDDHVWAFKVGKAEGDPI